MTRDLRVAAVDLGATSGRVMVGAVGPDTLELREAHRFANGPVRVGNGAGSTLYWDVLGIYREMITGLQKANTDGGPVSGIGIDSWAVDYGLLDADGTLLTNPVSYRDSRTDGVMERVLKAVSADELYDTTGLQQLPFNTLYQLVSALGTPALEAAETMLMIPDLLGYWLTGQVGAEATNASTTQLYDVRSRTWALELADRVGIPRRLLPPLRRPGTVVGPLLANVADESGLVPDVPVIAVGSHDTASAVVGVPMENPRAAAYISSGTWSLVGVELDSPVLSDEARQANFTNEGGVDDTYRFLKNVMGLWVLTETLRAWRHDGDSVDLPRLLAGASAIPPFRSVVNIDDPVFLPPGDMAGRIRDACRRTGQPVPDTKPQVARCILESLALAYRRNVRMAARLSGQMVEVVHVVGGGARNELLCQLTADACGVPVLAGPVEAAALGNSLVQARALGAPLENLAGIRHLIRRTHTSRRYDPQTDVSGWAEAEHRLDEVAPR